MNIVNTECPCHLDLEAVCDGTDHLMPALEYWVTGKLFSQWDNVDFCCICTTLFILLTIKGRLNELNSPASAFWILNWISSMASSHQICMLLVLFFCLVLFLVCFVICYFRNSMLLFFIQFLPSFSPSN